MTAVVLAHGGTGGAIVEGAFLLFPVAAFFFLSRWSKRREQAAADAGPEDEQRPDPEPEPEPGPGGGRAP